MEDVNAFRLTDQLHAEQGRGDPFAAAVRATRMPMIITDPRQRDNPIVFANNAFYRLTGYARRDTLGRNCRFLQGPETAEADISAIRDAVKARTDISIELLNYRKDGTTFWNALYLSPVFGEDGELQFFFSSQLDISEARERERRTREQKAFFEEAVHKRTAELEAALEQRTLLLHEVDHRVKNNLQMVAAMIRNQSRFVESDDARTVLEATLSRIETLGAVHRRLYQSKDVARFDASDFIRETANDLVHAANRRDIELTFDIDSVRVPASVVSPLSLVVNELITNALKHAFPDRKSGGTIGIGLSKKSDQCEIVIADNGVGLDGKAFDRPSFGHRMLTSLVAQINGSLEWSDARPGTRVTIQLPFEPEEGA